MLRSKHSFIFLILIFLFALQFCKPKDKIAPGFPPKESLTVDLDFFDQTAPAASYYEFAQLIVHNWTEVIYDSLEFYRQVYDDVIERDLEYQTKNTWYINFEKTYNDTSYTVNYFEKIVADTIELNLFVSYYRKKPETDEDSLTEVLLMQGTMTNYEYGEWTINLIDTGFNNTIKLLNIDWALKTNQNPEINITILGGKEKNNRLHYKDSIDNDYLYYIDILHEADGNHTFIQWNSSSNLGRIKDFNEYGNDEWHCWDENLTNKICP